MRSQLNAKEVDTTNAGAGRVCCNPDLIAFIVCSQALPRVMRECIFCISRVVPPLSKGRIHAIAHGWMASGTLTVHVQRL